MQAYYRPNNSSSLSFLLLMVIVSVISILLVSLFRTNGHMLEKHGSLAVQITQTLNCNGPLKTFQRESDGRQAHICQLEDGRFGVYICEGENPITCFKNRSSKIEEILNFLENRGYLVH